jgi:hypothetical protein
MHPGRLMLHLIEQQNPDILIDWDIRTVYFDDDELVLILSEDKRIVVNINPNLGESFSFFLQRLGGYTRDWEQIDCLEDVPIKDMANAVVGLITTNR